MKIRYQVIGKSEVEGLGMITYYLKLLYKEDGTPWWAATSGLELKVSKEYWETIKISQFIEITLSEGFN